MLERKSSLLKVTLNFLLLISIQYIGLLLALILTYASPDENVAHTYEASIFLLASSILSFSLLYNISFKAEKSNLMKYFYFLISILFMLSGILLGLICKYAHPMGIVDIPAMYLFFISSAIISLGLILMFKHNRGAKNE